MMDGWAHVVAYLIKMAGASESSGFHAWAVVLSRLGSARFGLAQQRFDQIGRAKPNQTMARGLRHGS